MLTTFCLSLIAIAAPTSAYAVNVSSNDESGEQHVTTWYGNGATLTGSLKSTSGKAVYYSGLVAINNCGDDTVSRYSQNGNTTLSQGPAGNSTLSAG